MRLTAGAGARAFRVYTSRAPKQVGPEDAALYYVFPYEAYDRRSIHFSPTAPEGMVYPSFSMGVHLSHAEVEARGPTEFTVSRAYAVAYCPVCGRAVGVVKEQEEVELLREVRPSREVAFEVAYLAVSKDLAARLLTHMHRAHSLAFKNAGKAEVLIARDAGYGNIVVAKASIATYECPEHGTRHYGVFGAAYHAASAHSGAGEAALGAAREALRAAAENLSLPEGSLAFINVFRRWFSVEVSQEGPRRALNAWFKLAPGVVMAVRSRPGGPVRVTYAFIGSRLERAVLHHPVMRPALLAMAYRLDPQGFLRAHEKAASILSSFNVKGAREAVESAVDAAAVLARYVEPGDLRPPTVKAVLSAARAVSEHTEEVRGFLERCAASDRGKDR